MGIGISCRERGGMRERERQRDGEVGTSDPSPPCAWLLGLDCFAACADG